MALILVHPDSPPRVFGAQAFEFLGRTLGNNQTASASPAESGELPIALAWSPSLTNTTSSP